MPYITPERRRAKESSRTAFARLARKRYMQPCLPCTERETSVHTDYEEMGLMSRVDTNGRRKKCEIPIELDRKELDDHLNELP